MYPPLLAIATDPAQSKPVCAEELILHELHVSSMSYPESSQQPYLLTSYQGPAQ